MRPDARVACCCPSKKFKSAERTQSHHKLFLHEIQACEIQIVFIIGHILSDAASQHSRVRDPPFGVRLEAFQLQARTFENSRSRVDDFDVRMFRECVNNSVSEPQDKPNFCHSMTLPRELYQEGIPLVVIPINHLAVRAFVIW